MLKHYFRLDNLKAQAAAMQSDHPIDGTGWMIGHRFIDKSTATLWPQLLDLVDSINSAPDRQTKELYAETAARILATSMLGIGMIAVEDHQEELVSHAQTAQQATDSIIKRVAGKK
jgi:hypothetical protein